MIKTHSINFLIFPIKILKNEFIHNKNQSIIHGKVILGVIQRHFIKWHGSAKFWSFSFSFFVPKEPGKPVRVNHFFMEPLQKHFIKYFDQNADKNEDLRDDSEESCKGTGDKGLKNFVVIIDGSGVEDIKDSNSTEEYEEDVWKDPEDEWEYRNDVSCVDFGSPGVKAGTQEYDKSQDDEACEYSAYIFFSIAQKNVKGGVEEGFDSVKIGDAEAGFGFGEVEELEDVKVGEEEGGEGHFVECVGEPVLSFVFGGVAVADAAFPDGDGFGEANDSDGDPAHQDEHQEGAGLYEGVELIRWVMNGVEVVIDTMEPGVHIFKSNGVEHEVLWVIGEDGGSGNNIARLRR